MCSHVNVGFVVVLNAGVICHPLLGLEELGENEGYFAFSNSSKPFMFPQQL